VSRGLRSVGGEPHRTPFFIVEEHSCWRPGADGISAECRHVLSRCRRSSCSATGCREGSTGARPSPQSMRNDTLDRLASEPMTRGDDQLGWQLVFARTARRCRPEGNARRGRTCGTHTPNTETYRRGKTAVSSQSTSNSGNLQRGDGTWGQALERSH